jgi:hypothetical protein
MNGDDLKNVSFEVFTAVKIEVKVFWVVTLCSVVVGYQCFRVVMSVCWGTGLLDSLEGSWFEDSKDRSQFWDLH